MLTGDKNADAGSMCSCTAEVHAAAHDGAYAVKHRETHGKERQLSIVID